MNANTHLIHVIADALIEAHGGDAIDWLDGGGRAAVESGVAGWRAAIAEGAWIDRPADLLVLRALRHVEHVVELAGGARIKSRIRALVDEDRHGRRSGARARIAAEAEAAEARIEAIHAAIERRSVFRREDRAIAGCIVTIGEDGTLAVVQGLVRPEDRAQANAVDGAAESDDGTAAQTSDGVAPANGYAPPHMDPPALAQGPARPPDPEAVARKEVGVGVGLADDLRSLRTAIVKAELACDFEAAFDLLLFQLARAVFERGYHDDALDIAVRVTTTPQPLRRHDVSAGPFVSTPNPRRPHHAPAHPLPHRPRRSAGLPARADARRRARRALRRSEARPRDPHRRTARVRGRRHPRHRRRRRRRHRRSHPSPGLGPIPPGWATPPTPPSRPASVSSSLGSAAPSCAGAPSTRIPPPKGESPMSHPPNDAATLAGALGQRAEAVCRRYLPAGRRQGRYWVAGDVHGAKGRSLFVRLRPPGVPGKWTENVAAKVMLRRPRILLFRRRSSSW